MDILDIVVFGDFGFVAFVFETRGAVGPKRDLDGGILGPAGQAGRQREDEKERAVHEDRFKYL